MREALTNRDLADRAMPDDGPVPPPQWLARLESSAAAHQAVEALNGFPLRRVLDFGGRFHADGAWVCFRGQVQATTTAYHLCVLFLRGVITGVEQK